MSRLFLLSVMQSVLFGLRLNLALHLGRSFLSRSYGYAFANDHPSCFASIRKGPDPLIGRMRYWSKSAQVRREEKSLVYPNKRRATQHGWISTATRRDEAIFPQFCVVARLYSVTKLRSRRLVLHKNGRRRNRLISGSGPSIPKSFTQFAG